MMPLYINRRSTFTEVHEKGADETLKAHRSDLCMDYKQRHLFCEFIARCLEWLPIKILLHFYYQPPTPLRHRETRCTEITWKWLREYALVWRVGGFWYILTLAIKSTHNTSTGGSIWKHLQIRKLDHWLPWKPLPFPWLRMASNI